MYGHYGIKSTQNIDLAFAQLYLIPIQKIIGFNLGPVPLMDLKGQGNIDIKTQGTIFDAQVFGEFRAKNTTLTFEGVNAKITNGNCYLAFEDKNVLIKDLNAKLDNSDLKLNQHIRIKIFVHYKLVQ